MLISYTLQLRFLFPDLPANGGPLHVYPADQEPLKNNEFVEGLEVEDPNL